MRPLPSRGDLISCLMQAQRPLHAREIAKRCGVNEGSYSRLLELLDQLSFDGTIARMPGGRFKAQPRSDGDSWEGVLSVNPRGFGFVTAAGQPDTYVAGDSLAGGMHGDRVRIAVLGRTARGVEGRVTDIVHRRNPRVAGVLRRRRKSSWLEPDDTRVRGPIVIIGRHDGDDGDAAVVSITRFPERPDENPEGELVAVLGVPGDPNAEVAKILVREEIDEAHPEAAMREAEAMAARLLKSPAEGRVDLRSVPLPTIDPEDARDHDDAIWVEKAGDGYRVWIAIADVSEYVVPGSALDQEAMTRGCTIYLPDRAIPMLPAALASDVCSLLPDAERLCMCVIAELDKAGDVTRFEIVEGVMRSQAMLTYGGVARALGFSERAPQSAPAEALKKGLRALDELARKLRRKRMRRGALDLDLPEPKVVLDPKSGAPIGVERRAEDPGIKRAYQMVEELMLLANELVAEWLSSKRSPAVYRVHARPDEKKLERLADVAERLGVQVDLDDMLDPMGVSRFLKKIADHPRKQVLESLLLRSLKQAVYDIVNVGHFGLASDAYLHFTSPIRRYPDIEVHRAVKHILRGNKPDTSPGAVETLRAAATRASVRERAAMDVEREVVDLYRALYMRDRIGDVLEGRISAMVGTGMFVTLVEPFVDVLVRYDALGPDRYELDDDELTVVGANSGDVLQLGDPIVVEIEDVAILRRVVLARRVPPDAVVRAAQGRSRGRGRGASKPSRSNPGASKPGARSAPAADRKGRGDRGGRSAGSRQAKGRGGKRRR
ncbi:MAG: ribonuclease R [Polyangiaceae bacterium]